MRAFKHKIEGQPEVSPALLAMLEAEFKEPEPACAAIGDPLMAFLSPEAKDEFNTFTGYRREIALERLATNSQLKRPHRNMSIDQLMKPRRPGWMTGSSKDKSTVSVAEEHS